MGCPAHAPCAHAGCGSPHCVPWAMCCVTASTALPAYCTATAAATELRAPSYCAWSQKTPRTSRHPPMTSSTSRNRPTSARTVDVWVLRAPQDAPATALHLRWTGVSCSAVAGVTARARSASPSVATAPSTGAATSAAATVRTHACCTSVCEPWVDCAPSNTVLLSSSKRALRTLLPSHSSLLPSSHSVSHLSKLLLPGDSSSHLSGAAPTLWPS